MRHPPGDHDELGELEGPPPSGPQQHQPGHRRQTPREHGHRQDHVAHVLDKLELRDRVEAVILAYAMDLASARPDGVRR